MLPIYNEDKKRRRTYNEIIPNANNEAFVFRIFADDKIHDFRHKHNEIEIIYIRNGQGRKSIADNSETCNDGDIALIGPGVPHFYTLDPVVSYQKVEAWVIQFDELVFGAKFFDYAETRNLKNLLKAAVEGVSFSHQTIVKTHDVWPLFAGSTGAERLLLFIKLMGILATPGGYFPVIGSATSNDIVVGNRDRMQKTKEFIQRNYANEVSLETLANNANLSKSAFCNLFKKTFNVCFSDYLTEIRLSKAAGLLAETDFSINEIYSKAGFSNQSYFNRCFKNHFRKTPNAYRKSLKTLIQ
jgi:AraC-like DNA-binding protein